MVVGLIVDKKSKNLKWLIHSLRCEKTSIIHESEYGRNFLLLKRQSWDIGSVNKLPSVMVGNKRKEDPFILVMNKLINTGL